MSKENQSMQCARNMFPTYYICIFHVKAQICFFNNSKLESLNCLFFFFNLSIGTELLPWLGSVRNGFQWWNSYGNRSGDACNGNSICSRVLARAWSQLQSFPANFTKVRCSWANSRRWFLCVYARLAMCSKHVPNETRLLGWYTNNTNNSSIKILDGQGNL